MSISTRELKEGKVNEYKFKKRKRQINTYFGRREGIMKKKIEVNDDIFYLLIQVDRNFKR